MNTRIPQGNRLQYGYWNPTCKEISFKLDIGILQEIGFKLDTGIPQEISSKLDTEISQEIGSKLDTGIPQGNRLQIVPESRRKSAPNCTGIPQENHLQFVETNGN
ncbi:unnamed protein product [Rhizophagus irregularis]|nr:unnamed protein product [Rhizophagus irregularis]